MDTSLDNANNPFANSNGADNNIMGQKTEGLLLNLSENFKHNGSDLSPTDDFYHNSEKSNGKRLASEFDDDDLGPETDVDAVDDVLSPSIAAAKALADGIVNNNPDGSFNPFVEKHEVEKAALELDLDLQKQQSSEFDGQRSPREETPTPPADAVHDGGLDENIGDSGEESEDEWNYIKGEEANKENVSPSQPDCEVAAILEEQDTMSQLNPNAAEFVPVSPTRSIPSPASRLINDPVLAQSPKRPSEIDINLPDPVDFEKEVKSRPSEVEAFKNGHDHEGDQKTTEIENLLNGKNIDDIPEFTPGNTPSKMSDEFHFGPNAAPFTPLKLLDQSEATLSTKAVYGDESEINLDSTLDDHVDFGGKLMKDEDPMSMSFYQDKSDVDPFDLNKVQLLPENIEDFLSKTEDGSDVAQDTILDLKAHDPLSDEIILNNDERIQTTDLDKIVDDEKELASPVSNDDESSGVCELAKSPQPLTDDLLGSLEGDVCLLRPESKSPTDFKAQSSEVDLLTLELQEASPVAVSPALPAVASEVVRDVLSPELDREMLSPEPEKELLALVSEKELLESEPENELLSPEPDKELLSTESEKDLLSPEAVSSPEPQVPESQGPPLSPNLQAPALSAEPQAPILSPEPREPVLSPEPREPVLSPEPREPVLLPEPQEPVLSPEPQEPVLSPEPQEPVLSPEPQEPVLPQAPQEPVLSPEPQIAVISPEPEALLSPSKTEFEDRIVSPEPSALVLSPEPREEDICQLPRSPLALAPSPEPEKIVTPEPEPLVEKIETPEPEIVSETCKLEEQRREVSVESPIEDITSSAKDVSSPATSPVPDLLAPEPKIELTFAQEISNAVQSSVPIEASSPIRQDDLLLELCPLSTPRSTADTESVTTTDVNSFLERSQIPDLTSSLSSMDQTLNSEIPITTEIKTENIIPEFAEPAVLTPTEPKEENPSVPSQNETVKEPEVAAGETIAIAATATAAVSGAAVIAVAEKKPTAKAKTPTAAKKTGAKPATTTTKPAASPTKAKAAPLAKAKPPVTKATTTAPPKPAPKPKTPTTTTARPSTERKSLTNGDVKAPVRSSLTAKKSTDAKTTTTAAAKQAPKAGPAKTAAPKLAPTATRTSTTKPATTSTAPKPRPSTLASKTTASTVTKITSSTTTASKLNASKSATSPSKPRPATAPAKPRVPLTKTITKTSADTEKQNKDSANKLTASRTITSARTIATASARSVTSTVRKTESKTTGTTRTTLTKTTTSTTRPAAIGRKPQEITRRAVPKAKATTTKVEKPVQNGITTVVTEQITIVNNVVNDSDSLMKDNSPIDNKLIVETNAAD